jgi:hypothetical protein
MEKIDVFISRKSADAPYARKLYEYLTAQGLTVFEADHTLNKSGAANYVKEIDQVLSRTTNMVVLGSSPENLQSTWVEAEWLLFLSLMRSGKISGKLITIITKKMEIDDLPPSLRAWQIIEFNKKNFPIVFNFLRPDSLPLKRVPATPYPAEKENKFLKILIVLILFLSISAIFYIKKTQRFSNISELFDLNTKVYNPAIHKEADLNFSNDCNLFMHDTNIKYSMSLNNNAEASAKNLKIKYFLKYSDGYEELDHTETINYIPKNAKYIQLEGFWEIPIRKKPTEIIIYLSYENEFSPRKTVKKFVITEPQDMDDYDSSYFLEYLSKIKLSDVFSIIDDEFKFPEKKILRSISLDEKNNRLIFKKHLATASLSAIGFYALYEKRDWAELKKYSSKRFNDFIESNKRRLLFETIDYQSFQLSYYNEFKTLNEKSAIFRMIPLPNTSSSRYWERISAFKNMEIMEGITPFKNFYDWGFEIAMVNENGKWKIDLHDEYNGVPDKNLNNE